MTQRTESLMVLCLLLYNVCGDPQLTGQRARCGSWPPSRRARWEPQEHGRRWQRLPASCSFDSLESLRLVASVGGLALTWIARSMIVPGPCSGWSASRRRRPWNYLLNQAAMIVRHSGWQSGRTVSLLTTAAGAEDAQCPAAGMSRDGADGGHAVVFAEPAPHSCGVVSLHRRHSVPSDGSPAERRRSATDGHCGCSGDSRLRF